MKVSRRTPRKTRPRKKPVSYVLLDGDRKSVHRARSLNEMIQRHMPSRGDAAVRITHTRVAKGSAPRTTVARVRAARRGR